ncbi:hypothetical protein, partial [uncultured Alcanivorax sp.]|uniref:hypothetical protein n=1 Tax=uncultured Alcanivorax sp. TaxID=191215 RepID=UPI00261DEE9D
LGRRLHNNKSFSHSQVLNGGGLLNRAQTGCPYPTMTVAGATQVLFGRYLDSAGMAGSSSAVFRGASE